MSALTTTPEVGQVVTVRERPFVVTDVLQSSLPPSANASVTSVGQHLISLTSVADDGQGEQIRVVWELEPGARADEVRRLPDVHDFDDPRTFDAFLDAVRWGAISSADRKRLQSPFRAGIKIEDYQLDPLARAIEMPRVNLLIADDVGLGKTIEAGLIALELILRQRAQRVLIVCPATLAVQWQEQMQDKFGLSFQIVNRDYFKQVRRARGIHVNPWSTHPRMIVSIDFLKQARVKGLLKDTFRPDAYPRSIDLLIVDEAANIAPAGVGKYARASDRTQAIREIAPHSEHRLFLTATPHNGYRESFAALLELVDDQRFARGVPWDPKQLERVMIRRMKNELVDAFGKPKFKERQVNALDVTYSESEQSAHRMLKEYAKSRQEQAVDGDERHLTQFVLTLLKKRMFSSPAAFALTLEKHTSTLQQTRTSQTLRAKGDILRQRLRQLEQDVQEGDEFDEELESSLDEAVSRFKPLTPRERELLAELKTWAEGARNRADSKAKRLIEWLDAEIKPNGKWSDQRVIIFTEYRDTLGYIYDLLERAGYTAGNHIEILTGSTDGEERERIKSHFQADPRLTPVRILLATDAISEGLDLQLHCSKLIHYEIPWNPNRLEQRNGRIDRHGQRGIPMIYHFAPTGLKQTSFVADRRSDLEDDLEFLALAVKKIQSIRADLGSYGDVIADRVRQAMLEGGKVSLDVENDSTRAQQLVHARNAIRLTQNVRDRLHELRTQVFDSERELHLQADHVRSVVDVALRVWHQPPLKPVTLSDGVQAFEAGSLTGGWAACLRGMIHPITLKQRPLVFDRALAEDRDDVVLAHLQHPLVDRALTLLRAEVWRGDAGDLNRVTARTAPDHLLNDPIIVAHGRIVVAGADGKRLHEQVISASCSIAGNRLTRLNVTQTVAAMDASSSSAVPKGVGERLAELWPNHRESLESALRARLTDVQNGIRRDLEQRLIAEKKEIADRLNELGRQIDKEIGALDLPQQLGLFGDDKNQFDRDIDSIRERRKRIPADIDLEHQALENRYSIREPHLFPIAVEYIVPQSVASDLGGRR